MSPSDIHTRPDYDRCALVTIDLQNDTLPGGTFAVAGTDAILYPIETLCRSFRTAGRPIAHVIRIYSPDGSDADRCRRQALQDGSPLLLKGSAGRRPVDALLPSEQIAIDDERLMAGETQNIGPNEIILYKPRWGAFYRTPLSSWLQEKAVSTLVFAGCNFPNCPRSSIYQASERDFRIVAATDAISGLQPGDIQVLEAIGVTCIPTDQIEQAIASRR